MLVVAGVHNLLRKLEPSAPVVVARLVILSGLHVFTLIDDGVRVSSCYLLL